MGVRAVRVAAGEGGEETPPDTMLPPPRWIAVVESVIDTYDSAAVRVDLGESLCRYEGETIAGRFRVCQTWVTVEGTPRLAAVQYTSSADG